MISLFSYTPPQTIYCCDPVVSQQQIGSDIPEDLQCSYKGFMFGTHSIENEQDKYKKLKTNLKKHLKAIERLQYAKIESADLLANCFRRDITEKDVELTQNKMLSVTVLDNIHTLNEELQKIETEVVLLNIIVNQSVLKINALYRELMESKTTIFSHTAPLNTSIVHLRGIVRDTWLKLKKHRIVSVAKQHQILLLDVMQEISSAISTGVILSAETNSEDRIGNRSTSSIVFPSTAKKSVRQLTINQKEYLVPHLNDRCEIIQHVVSCSQITFSDDFPSVDDLRSTIIRKLLLIQNKHEINFDIKSIAFIATELSKLLFNLEKVSSIRNVEDVKYVFIAAIGVTSETIIDDDQINRLTGIICKITSKEEFTRKEFEDIMLQSVKSRVKYIVDENNFEILLREYHAYPLDDKTEGLDCEIDLNVELDDLQSGGKCNGNNKVIPWGPSETRVLCSQYILEEDMKHILFFIKQLFDDDEFCEVVKKFMFHD